MPNSSRSSDLIAKLLFVVKWLPCLALLSIPLTHAETQSEWSARALRLQANIDLNAPFTQTTWIGSHNSTSNPGDDSMLDYNQKYSVKDQLSMGIRELVFDIHWDRSALRVCHNNISKYGECISGVTGNRKLKNALNDINDWINDGHRDQVILLKLEFGSDVKERINKLEGKLEREIGSILYRPDSTNLLGDAGSKDCTNLPAQTITKADILKAGKNIITYTSNNCINDRSFNSTTFYDHNSSWIEDVNSISKLNENWSLNKHLSVVSRLKDGATKSGILGSSDVKMHENNVMEFMKAGLNIIETYGFGAGDSWRHNGENPVGPEDVVWSWSERNHQPNPLDSCAILKSDDDRIASNDCNGKYLVACRVTANDYLWEITTMYYDISNTQDACTEMGSQYTFATPINAKDMKALINTRNNAGQNTDDIWINYQKTNNIWTAELAL